MMSESSALRELRQLRRDRTGQAFRLPINRRRQSVIPGKCYQPPIIKALNSASSSNYSKCDSSTSTGNSSRSNSSVSQILYNSSVKFLSNYSKRRSKRKDCEGEESLSLSLLSPNNRYNLEEEDANFGREENGLYPYRSPSFRKRLRRILDEEEEEQSLKSLFFCTKKSRRTLSDIIKDDHSVEENANNNFCSFSCYKERITKRKILLYIFLSLFTTLISSEISFKSYIYESNHNLKQRRNRLDVIIDNQTIMEREIEQRIELLNSLRNLTTPYNPRNETSFFLDVPLTGSEIIKKSISKCYNLTMACELGLRQPNFDEDTLGVFKSKIDGSYFGDYVNVDLSSLEGIKRAKKLGLIESQYADVISMELLYENGKIYDVDQGYGGRLFMVFAHPISRAIGYYFKSNVTWDKEYNPVIGKMTLKEYANSTFVPDNPMVRLITNKMIPNELGQIDLELAKRIVQLKVLVGLYRDLDGSLARFDRYFSWDVVGLSNDSTSTNPVERRKEIEECNLEVLKGGDRWLSMYHHYNNHNGGRNKVGSQTERRAEQIVEDKVQVDKMTNKFNATTKPDTVVDYNQEVNEEGNELWELLSTHNKYDLKLYEYVERIYDIQGDQIFAILQ